MSNFKMTKQDSFTCLRELSSGSDWRSSLRRLSSTRSLGEEAQSASLLLVRPRIRSGSVPNKVRHDSSSHSEEITSFRLDRTAYLQDMRETERHGLSFDKGRLDEWKLPIVPSRPTTVGASQSFGKRSDSSVNLPDLSKNSDNLKLHKKTSLKERHVEDAETTFDLVKSKAEYTATWLSDQQLN